MRVLFITRKYPPSTGGMETYSFQLATHFPLVGGDVDVFKPEPPILGRPTLSQLCRFLIAACRLLATRSKSYDAVLIGDYAIAALAIVAKVMSRGRLRTVVSLHGNDLYFMRQEGMGPAAYRAISFLLSRSGLIDATIANSRAILAEAVARGLPCPTVIPLGTNPPPPARGHHTRHPGRILFAGRLIRYKGLSWFVKEVWPRLPRPRELLVAGPVWDTHELDCLKGLQDATYLGTLPPEDLACLRETCVASIMPNLPPSDGAQDEGFGLVALESASAGTPVVASACGGIPDAVSDGRTGFLLPPLAADAWVEKLSEIFNWPSSSREEWAASARNHVATYYTWEITARSTLEVLGATSRLTTDGSRESLR